MPNEYANFLVLNRVKGSWHISQGRNQSTAKTVVRVAAALSTLINTMKDDPGCWVKRWWGGGHWWVKQ